MTREETGRTTSGQSRTAGRWSFLKETPPRRSTKPDVSLIGQFGVGFYSAFMLADKVRVRTRSYTRASRVLNGSPTARALSPSRPSRGRRARDRDHPPPQGRFVRPRRATYRIKHVLKTYSGFVPHPIKVGGEVVNNQKPIWVEPKGQVTDEQHAGFFQYLTHQVDESPALAHPLRGRLADPVPRLALLPEDQRRAPWVRSAEHGINLCAKRILVQNDNRDLLPEYLRFLYGLVDSEDLPLNVSRETLQDSSGHPQDSRASWSRGSSTS